ncbi:MAG: hypothetical protein J6U53_04450 [Tidjanibacter sp.]|nr:hypothetical protein [Tidjanibacter sp.]
MKKYIIYMVFAMAVGLTACEKEWENVPLQSYATEEEVRADGYTFISVNELKEQYFYSELADPKGTVKSVIVPDKVALKTKVISSDELGNTYKSLYVQDAEGCEKGGIEIKVGKGSMYTYYKPGQIIYIKCDGLHLGNYRHMLSLGGNSSEDKYSNGYIDIQSTIDEKILRGEMIGLNAADTLVVNQSNVANIISNDKKYLGTLCRFEGIESVWGTVKHDSFSDNDIFPSFLESVNDTYTNYVYSDYRQNPEYPDGLPATWAYSYYDNQGNSNSYYGSALFTFGDSYPFIVRTSGYSRFALNPIPTDGKIVDMTAILTKYCSSGGGWTKYQLVLNSDKDVVW